MPFPPLPTQIKCPRCGHSYVVQVHTVIDIGQQPELKEAFFRGQVNYGQCSQCGAAGLLSTPLLYHDPTKELLISYMPAEMGLSADEQEKIVGNLVNAVMNELPAEKRKGYFLRPRSALTMEGLYDAILEADGISKEALEAHRSLLRLIQQLLDSLEDEKALDQLVEEHREKITYEFFLTLSDMIDQAQADQEAEYSAELARLREALLAKVSLAPQKALEADASIDEIIDMLQAIEDDTAWRQALAMNYQRLDYSFFQSLTAKIESAQKEKEQDKADSLTRLRDRILAELDAQRQRAREAEDEASLLIMTLSEATDLSASVREHKTELNEIFFVTLARLTQTAQSRNNATRLAKLQAIEAVATDVLEEDLPPAARLVNRLIRAEYPEGTNQVLEQHRGLLNQELLQTLDGYVEFLQQNKDSTLADHLTQVKQQVAAKLTILRG